LSTWRKQYHDGALQRLRNDKRGRKATKHPLEDEVAQLRKTNARLSHRLQQPQTIIEIHKKSLRCWGFP
jgi:hypothetical protein